MSCIGKYCPQQHRNPYCGGGRHSKEVEYHQQKWQKYEAEYVLPLFEMANDAGINLNQLVLDAPGKNCVILLTEHLIAQNKQLREQYEVAYAEGERNVLSDRIEEEEEEMKQVTSVTLSTATKARIDRQRAVVGAAQGRPCSRSELVEAALNDFVPMSFHRWLIDQTEEDTDIGTLARDYNKKQNGPIGNSLWVWLRWLADNNGCPESFEALTDAHATWLASYAV